MRRIIALPVAAVLVCGCGDDEQASVIDTPSTGLPSDPNDWACEDSLVGASATEIDEWCASHPDRGLPLPEVFRSPPPLNRLEEKNAYDEALEVFVKAERYKRDLGWLGDATWRFTGPYVGEIGSGSGYGTHLPVHVYYSPDVIDWLCNGRRGEIPAGAMIIKEMHLADSNLGVTADVQGCMTVTADPGPQAWSMMIRNDEHAHDGWFWLIIQRDQLPLYPEERVDPPVVDRSGFTAATFVESTPTSPDPHWYPTGYFSENADKIPNVISPQIEYGAFCMSCHASAATHSTFASLDNVIGKSIQYKQFAADDDAVGSDLGTHVLAFTGEAASGAAAGDRTPHPASDDGFDTPFTTPLASANPAFLSFYDQLSPVSFARAWELRLPAETYDHVLSPPGGPASFLTSDQCAPCHDAVKYLGDLTPMIVEEEIDGQTQAVSLAEFAEWNVSPMGLAGRDPIFFSQLEGETNHLPDLAACIENTCLHCHAVMGQRQLAADTEGQDEDDCGSLFAVAPPPQVPAGRPFRLERVMQWPGEAPRDDRGYGALARDGISCTVCHRIAAQDLGSEETFTGNFVTGPLDEVYGPYEKVSTKPMENGLGITPKHGKQIADADLCGSCHNILLPVFTNAGVRTGFSYEQTTHLEWLNSDYAADRSLSATCQDCHMPTTYNGEALSFAIANFESDGFPPTTFRLPDDEITAPVRDRYARHSLHGLNIFLNELFQQFPLLLGFRQAERFNRTQLDYPPLLLGEDSIIDMARSQTAGIEVRSLALSAEGVLRATVRVTNRTGHYLPSGVGFRRAFLEFSVRDENGDVLWASGRTNELGAIVAGTTDQVLPTEQPLRFPVPGYQPHYQVITRSDQVQIYQEVVVDSEGDVTASFLRRVQRVKDNRIRPQGYDPRFYESFGSPYIRALAETPGAAQDDPDYTDPDRTGADEVEYLIALDPETRARVADVAVALYSQSIPPPYLAERFRDATAGAAQQSQTDRLYYMTSHFRTDTVTDRDGAPVIDGWKLQLASATRALK